MHAQTFAIDLTPETAMPAVWLVWLISWMAAAAWSDRAAKRPGARHEIVYRLLVVGGAMLLFGVPGHRLQSELILWPMRDDAGWAMVAVALAGLLFTWWARLHLGRLWSSSVTRKAEHHVVDSGPYGIVRHPIYTGLTLAAIATAVMRGTLAGWLGLGLMTLGWYVKARLEEHFLREQLGAEAYGAYARRVPMLIPFLVVFLAALLSAVAAGSAQAPQGQTPPAAPRPPKSVLGATPAPQSIPTPGPATDQPYAPQAILPGGIVVPVFPAGSPLLKADRIKEPEVYNMAGGIPGRIASIVNIHNPSIELHKVPGGMNTGAAVIVVAGGGHNTLNVGSEGADFVPFFYNYGINTIILRYRLRRDGYNSQIDPVNDMLQAIKVVRAYAEDLGIDPKKIGAIGFSAGAELTAPAALKYPEFDKTHDVPGNPLAKISSRPDFVGLIYPGPSPFRGGAEVAIPDDAPPSFIAGGGVGDAVHAVWADEYFAAFLRARIPNLEMHIYGNGRHPGDPLPEGGNMSGGLSDRNGIPLGTWQFRFIDWVRDLGFMQKPGVETKAARDAATRAANPPRPPGQRGRGGHQ